MAKVLGGLLGGFSGKVGGLVGGRWKNIQYARGYVKPANPNTEGQQYYRARFKEMAMFAIGILGSVLNEYMSSMVRSMSAFNWFIKRNTPAKMVDFDPTLVVMTEGQLYPAAIGNISYIGDSLSVAFSTAIGNNGLTTDLVFALAYKEESSAFTQAPAEVLRSTGTISLPVLGPTGTFDVYVITCRRDTAGNIKMVGTSQFKQSVVA